MNVRDLHKALGELMEIQPESADKPVDLTDGWGRACRWNGNLSAIVDSVIVDTRVYRTRTASAADEAGSVVLSAREVVTILSMLEGRSGLVERAKVFTIGDARIVTEQRVHQIRSRMLSRIRIALSEGRYITAYTKVYRGWMK